MLYDIKVSNAAMRRGDLDGLWKLSLLTSTLAGKQTIYYNITL